MPHPPRPPRDRAVGDDVVPDRRRAYRALAAWGLLVVAAGFVVATGFGNLTGDEEPAGEATADDGVHVTADYSQEWSEDGTNVALFRGNVTVTQGRTNVRARQAVVWHEADRTGTRPREFLSLYLEDDVVLERTGATRSGTSLYLEMVTSTGITHEIRRRLRDTDGRADPVYKRGLHRRKGTEPPRNRVANASFDARPTIVTRPGGTRRVRVFPRSAVPYNVESFPSEHTTPPEQIWMLTGGVNLIVDGDQQYGTVDLAADRIVIWTQPNADGQFRAETLQSGDAPFQVYLEGNIVMRQGAQVIRAARAFYDAREDRGLVLNAELRSPLRDLDGTIRIRAERIRQHSGSRFHAQNGWATASEFGKPGYRLQASDIFLEKRYVRPWLGARDPATGAPLVEEVNWITTENNTILVNDLPVFYNRRISAPAEDPNIPINRLSVGSDSIFGTQVESSWNLFRLTGIEEPDNVDWNLLADFRSERGFGLGTDGRYQGTGGLFGIPGTYDGRGIVYGMTDSGPDNLGGFRQNSRVDDDFRHRIQINHRHRLPDGTAIFGEIGLLSDRNVLEQYWEGDVDSAKDADTRLQVRHLHENWGITGQAAVRVNDFDTTTDWLPRVDLYGLSEPLLGGRATWSHHSYAGYANLQPGAAPSDPTELFYYTPLTDPLAGPASPNGLVANTSGAVLMTRHQLDAPLHLGPLNVTPYVMGEAAHWGGGFDGGTVDRLVGATGVRTSILFWKVYPHVQSRLFNLNGLAHKMRFEAGYHLVGSTESLANVPQYNDLDDNAEERFREFFVDTTFGGTLPATLEPRYYALRSGAGYAVTSPYNEVVDDQQVARFAWRHRLQTKVGPPDRLRIRDWMTLDLEASYFPNADRDNFGEEIGLLQGRYVWNFSDRTSLIASAQHDLFDNAPSIRNLAFVTQRGQRGSVYLGYRQFEFGGVNQDYVTASYTYRLSPKWVSTFGTTIDVAEIQPIGTSLTMSRIGRDFVTHMGFQVSDIKDNFGFVFMVEPKIGRMLGGPLQLSSLSGSGNR